jgi:signal transduction histidine kinase
LLTSLSDPVDVVRGLECGADSFIFKPYDEQYLLARIAYILANRHLRESESTRMGVEIVFAGRRFFITSDRLQILNLLLSTYEAAVQRSRELATTRDELRHLNEHLEAKVKERTAALQMEVSERRRAEEQVRQLNAELEQRVHERTAELEAANKELEAFSYSVSHDLRTPVRHIDGFLELLRKNAGTTLDAKGQRYLNQIGESAKEMGALIDNLLSFSRLGRGEMRATQVNLEQLIQDTIKDLAPETAGRDIVWKIAPLPEVRADHALLRQAVVNLISNALKYSRTRPRTEIEIGCPVDPCGEHVVFIRDNGVGFDMKYADKLFGVFQRLHEAEEFEGTGIGLANVQRIIGRHGGRTWAEGAVNGGATFYFSLPQSPSLQP